MDQMSELSERESETSEPLDLSSFSSSDEEEESNNNMHRDTLVDRIHIDIR